MKLDCLIDGNFERRMAGIRKCEGVLFVRLTLARS